MKFRILSLDGGGMRGIVPAHILKIVEQTLGGPLWQQFDLVAGTSTGAIIAGAIAKKLSAETIASIYEKQGAEIFPYQRYTSPQRLGLMIQHGFSAPKFSSRGLRRVIEQHLGPLTLGEITPHSPDGLHLLLTSYDTIRRTPIIFKSWSHHKWYTKLPVAEACIGSASAPTFFPAHRIDPKAYSGNKGYSDETEAYSLVDGGICANNPTSCAVVAALRILRKRYPSRSIDRCLQDIKVLSIGTGDTTEPLPWERVRGWGLSQWALHISDVFMDAPNDIHRYIAEQIMPHSSRNYLRLQIKLDKALDVRMGLGRSQSLFQPKYTLRSIDDARPLWQAKLVDATEGYLDTLLPESSRTVREELDALLSDW